VILKIASGKFETLEETGRMKTINLLFAVHNHQPVGNFEKVFHQGWKNCYEPFLALLEKHPQFRLSLHYSGSLLEWLEENQPSFLPRLRQLVARGQVELLSGGFYEPLLPFIPEKDAVGQILLLNQYLRDKFQAQAQGFWLAERVWNTILPKIIAPTRLKYTIVDDSHFRYAGLADEDMFGHYVTEHEGYTLSVFPINKRLRYAIPFRPPEETIEALRFWALDSGHLAVTYADDGEKFGLWPGTYGWVFGEKWLEKFVTLLEENQEWVHMLTFSEYMEKFPPQGRAYLPAVAYDEMMVWALPPLSAIGYEDMIHELKQEGRYQKYRAYLRGGSWENFLVKYPEGNHLHKKMLYVSAKVHRALKECPSLEAEEKNSPLPALKALWKGQDNSAYWHGLFAGLYNNYLRQAIYENLITAELLAEVLKWGGEKYLEHEIYDLDKDLNPEVLVAGLGLGAVLKPNYGGSLVELDYRPKKFNLTNVLTRRPESYHRKLKKALNERGSLTRPEKEELGGALMYDWYTRYSFLDHFLGEETTFDQFRRCQYPEVGNFVNQPYELVEVKELENPRRLAVLLLRSGGLFKKDGQVPLDVSKRFIFHRDLAEMEVDYEIANRSPEEANLWFGVEMNLTLHAGNDSQTYFLFPGLKVEDQRMISSGALSDLENIRLRGAAVGFEVSLDVAPASHLWRFPLETISHSERGLEKTYQGSVLFFHWRFALSLGEKKRLSFRLSCSGI